jgi:hypothetical protein
MRSRDVLQVICDMAIEYLKKEEIRTNVLLASDSGINHFWLQTALSRNLDFSMKIEV